MAIGPACTKRTFKKAIVASKYFRNGFNCLIAGRQALSRAGEIKS
jgi:hypothetical protein